MASKVSLKDYPFLTILTRCKKNYVAYFLPEQPTKKKRGRPAKYGQMLKLRDGFQHKDKFQQTEALIYGKKENIRWRSERMLWKATKTLMLFIWADTSRGQMVLMSNDLNLNPVTAIECYCLRIRIETIFHWLKNLLGAFTYRFWSKSLPRHSRRPFPNTELKPPPPQQQHNVNKVWEAYERFVMLACISLGLLKLLALL